MASSPAPATPDSTFRRPNVTNRSVTLPHILATGSRPDASPDTSSPGSHETLFTHSHVTIVKFKVAAPKTPVKSSSPSRQSSSAGTLPWRTPTETTMHIGAVEIFRRRDTVVYLSFGNISHPVFKRTQCWCVDGVSKFAIKILTDTYYRIELPATTEQDLQQVEDLKIALGNVAWFEKSTCPFSRTDDTDLPEMPDVVKRSGKGSSRAKKWKQERAHSWRPEDGLFAGGSQFDSDEASDSQPSSSDDERRSASNSMERLTDQTRDASADSPLASKPGRPVRSFTAPIALSRTASEERRIKSGIAVEGAVMAIEHAEKEASVKAATNPHIPRSTKYRTFQSIPTDMPPSPPGSSAGLENVDQDSKISAIYGEYATNERDETPSQPGPLSGSALSPYQKDTSGFVDSTSLSQPLRSMDHVNYGELPSSTKAEQSLGPIPSETGPTMVEPTSVKDSVESTHNSTAGELAILQDQTAPAVSIESADVTTPKFQPATTDIESHTENKTSKDVTPSIEPEVYIGSTMSTEDSTGIEATTMPELPVAPEASCQMEAHYKADVHRVPKIHVEPEMARDVVAKPESEAPVEHAVLIEPEVATELEHSSEPEVSTKPDFSTQSEILTELDAPTNLEVSKEATTLTEAEASKSPEVSQESDAHEQPMSHEVPILDREPKSPEEHRSHEALEADQRPESHQKVEQPPALAMSSAPSGVFASGDILHAQEATESIRPDQSSTHDTRPSDEAQVDVTGGPQHEIEVGSTLQEAQGPKPKADLTALDNVKSAAGPHINTTAPTTADESLSNIVAPALDDEEASAEATIATTDTTGGIEDPYAAIQARILARRSIGGTTAFHPSHSKTSVSTIDDTFSSHSQLSIPRQQQQEPYAIALFNRAFSTILAPPAYVAAVGLRIAARLATAAFGVDSVLHVATPPSSSKEVPGNFGLGGHDSDDDDEEVASSDEDDFGVPLRNAVRLAERASHSRDPALIATRNSVLDQSRASDVD